MSVLIIEDNQKLAHNIARFLEADTFSTATAHDGESGLEKALHDQYDAIILDLNLPKMDGLAICASLRENGITTPVLMLTARAGAKEAVIGLNVGADDYLAKPFDLDELVARIRALIRRQLPTKNPLLCFADLSVDTNSHMVKVAGSMVSLAPKEYALLEYLLQHQGTVQDRTTLLSHVWGEEPDMLFSQTVDVHIAYIRRKIGKEYIRTVSGKGYLVPESLASDA
jgi:DNA-binding response OmpR family regulator